MEKKSHRARPVCYTFINGCLCEVFVLRLLAVDELAPTKEERAYASIITVVSAEMEDVSVGRNQQL